MYFLLCLSSARYVPFSDNLFAVHDIYLIKHIHRCAAMAGDITQFVIYFKIMLAVYGAMSSLMDISLPSGTPRNTGSP